MSSSSASRRILLGLVFALSGVANTAHAGSAEKSFHEAYYLEHSHGDLAGAAKLYEKVASDRRTDPELRSKAQARLAAVREELAGADLARLMPPDALAYAELRRPGDRIMSLLGKLGLMAEPGSLPEAGAKRLAISPDLVRELLGIRGLAVAVTGFDPKTQTPSGVVVFNPGNLKAIRGLIATGLPLAGNPVESIGGFPTYDLEGEAIVTLTSRLVIASTDRDQIAGVVRRLNSKKEPSLADSPALAGIGADRDDALLLFFVNAKPLIPFIKQGMASGGSSHELAIAQAVLDIDSLQSLTGRVSIGEDGIGIDIALRLDEGHRNLVFNFLRTPAINRDTLQCIPGGAAAFLVGALNEAPSRFGATPSSTDALPIVTALDLGRELFANITSIALYLLPPDEAGTRDGFPIPDVGLALTVNDPSKSEALWTQFLGLANMASGTGGMEGTPVKIEGVKVRTFRMPEGPVIHFATLGHDVIITSSASAMARSIHSKKKGASVLDDPAFAQSLARLGSDTTRAVVVHAGRCAKVAGPFMSPGDMKEIGPVLGLLSETTAALMMEHSDSMMRLSINVSGIPDVGDMVAGLLTQHQHQDAQRRELTRAMKSGNWDEALAAVETRLAEHPESVKLLRKKFDVLAVGRKDQEAAGRCAGTIFDKTRDDAKTLNNFAWALLTEEKYGRNYGDLALKMSERSNDLTNHENWMFLDTLAVASFDNGNVQNAIEFEKKAIDLCKGGGVEELKKALARFEDRLAKR